MSNRACEHEILDDHFKCTGNDVPTINKRYNISLKLSKKKKRWKLSYMLRECILVKSKTKTDEAQAGKVPYFIFILLYPKDWRLRWKARKTLNNTFAKADLNTVTGALLTHHIANVKCFWSESSRHQSWLSVFHNPYIIIACWIPCVETGLKPTVPSVKSRLQIFIKHIVKHLDDSTQSLVDDMAEQTL